MSEEFEIVSAAAQPAVCVRTATTIENLPKEIGGAFGLIFGYLGRSGVQPAGPPFVAYVSMDTNRLEAEIGVPVGQELPVEGEVVPSHIPAGRFAVGMHRGPYEKISETYAALTTWLQEHGERPGIFYEYYLNSPEEVAPEDLLTRVSVHLD